jgi:outer membrane protein assembly factor BamB
VKLSTVVALLAVVVGLAGVAVVALAGGPGVLGLADGPDATLSEVWVSDTGRSVSANHHAPAVDAVDGVVYAPVSDDGGTAGRCALYALDARDGGVRWEYRVPGEACFIHSVADPTVADYDEDGAREVLAATTEDELAAFDATGRKEFAQPLADYGYTEPVVADLASAPGREVVVVDTTGTVHVVSPDGATANSDEDAGADGEDADAPAAGRTLWTHRLDAYVWARPVVADHDADGDPELLVGDRSGNVTLLSGDGTVEWRAADVGTVSWSTVGDVDDDPATEAFLATIDGDVVALDGRDGAVTWRTTVGAFASVQALTDGDGDGTTEVYAATKSGTVLAVNATDGTVDWRTSVTPESVQMMPPPVAGDLDGDGSEEVVVAANDGSVTVLDPASGDVLTTYARDVKVFAHPETADLDGDGDEEVLVLYADGRVVALSYDVR